MREMWRRPWWAILFWFAAWAAGLARMDFAQDCARTPAEAVGWTQTAAFSPGIPGHGFRIISMRWDPVLQQQWALIASCAHPEWPATELPMRGPRIHPKRIEYAGALLPESVVVRAGDAVQLWSQQGNLRIEAAATAEQSGALGQTIRVRLMQRKTIGQQAEEEFSVVVRGPREVEMQP